jgi:hypothetical protein
MTPDAQDVYDASSIFYGVLCLVPVAAVALLTIRWWERRTPKSTGGWRKR